MYAHNTIIRRYVHTNIRTYHHSGPEDCQDYDTDPKHEHLVFPRTTSNTHPHATLGEKKRIETVLRKYMYVHTCICIHTVHVPGLSKAASVGVLLMSAPRARSTATWAEFRVQRSDTSRLHVLHHAHVRTFSLLIFSGKQMTHLYPFTAEARAKPKPAQCIYILLSLYLHTYISVTPT